MQELIIWSKRLYDYSGSSVIPFPGSRKTLAIQEFLSADVRENTQYVIEALLQCRNDPLSFGFGMNVTYITKLSRDKVTLTFTVLDDQEEFIISIDDLMNIVKVWDKLTAKNIPYIILEHHNEHYSIKGVYSLADRCTSLTGNNFKQECLDLLKPHVIPLTDKEFIKIRDLFRKVTTSSWVHIQWYRANHKKIRTSQTDIMPILRSLLKPTIDENIYIFWHDPSLPIFKTNLTTALSLLEHIMYLGSEAWFFNITQGYIIKFEYFYKIHIGLIPK